MKKLKTIPIFKNEEEERKFWETHDSTEYVDWSRADSADFPNLKPSTETISLRLPRTMLHDLKRIAHQKDVPYQSLIKILLDEKVRDLLYRKS